jgi:hypothetical protein
MSRRLSKSKQERVAQITDQLSLLKSDFQKAYAENEDCSTIELEMLVLEQERDEITGE